MSTWTSESYLSTKYLFQIGFFFVIRSRFCKTNSTQAIVRVSVLTLTFYLSILFCSFYVVYLAPYYEQSGWLRYSFPYSNMHMGYNTGVLYSSATSVVVLRTYFFLRFFFTILHVNSIETQFPLFSDFFTSKATSCVFLIVNKPLLHFHPAESSRLFACCCFLSLEVLSVL